MMILGSKGQKAVHACMIKLLNLGPAEHEEVAIYIVNQRIPNVCRIAGAVCRWHTFSTDRSGYGDCFAAEQFVGVR